MSETAKKTDLTGQIDIPEPPDIIELLQHTQADLNTIGQMIAQEEALAAEVVNTINAPCFNLVRNIANIEEAVRFLGQDRVIRLATARSLRGAFFNTQSSFTEEVWNVANRVATACVLIARDMKLTTPEIAYEMGLFHNIGMALMYNHTSHYRKVIRSAYKHESGAIAAFECHHLGISHADISGQLASRWGVDEMSAVVIQHHHDMAWIQQQFDDENDGELLKRIALIKIAERISHTCGFIAQAPVNYEWEKIAPAIMNDFDLNEMKFERLKRRILEGMKEES